MAAAHLADDRLIRVRINSVVLEHPPRARKLDDVGIQKSSDAFYMHTPGHLRRRNIGVSSVSAYCCDYLFRVDDSVFCPLSAYLNCEMLALSMTKIPQCVVQRKHGDQSYLSQYEHRGGTYSADEDW